MKYAIHNDGVAFLCKKVHFQLSVETEAIYQQGSNTAEVCTQTSATIVDNIRTIYGDTIARELLHAESACDEEKLNYKVNAYLTNPNYSLKTGTFILFINSSNLFC